MSARIYLEGGGDSKAGKIACQKGFRNLLEKCGLQDRMPRLVACGSRNSAYDDFRTAHTVLGRLNPNTLEPLLPSFRRARRILAGRL